MILGRLPAAVGATVRQGHVDDLVGFAAGNLAVGLGAVILAGLAPRRGRRIPGRPLGKRSGLPLGRAQDFVEMGCHLADLGFQVGNSLKQLFVGGLGHP